MSALRIGDYVVSIDNQDTTEPSWDIGIVRLVGARIVRVWWLVADETCTEHRSDVRMATLDEYNFAREEKGIDP